MADIVDMAIGGGGVFSLGSILFGLLKWGAQRNITAIDASLQSISLRQEKDMSTIAVSLNEISKELREQGDKSIRQEKDVQILTTGLELATQRVEGLSKYWREQFEEQRKTVHQRLEKATVDLCHAMDALNDANAMLAMKTRKKP